MESKSRCIYFFFGKPSGHEKIHFLSFVFHSLVGVIQSLNLTIFLFAYFLWWNTNLVFHLLMLFNSFHIHMWQFCCLLIHNLSNFVFFDVVGIFFTNPLFLVRMLRCHCKSYELHYYCQHHHYYLNSLLLLQLVAIFLAFGAYIKPCTACGHHIVLYVGNPIITFLVPASYCTSCS